MLILVTYDVATSTQGGTRRLRKVAKICQNYGQRVQNSVFECIVDSTQLEILKNELVKVIDHEADSLRFYHLGKNYEKKVKHIGAKPSIDLEGTLIF
ncbi:CRISPR-associated endonuclease Cas2 [Enterococcus sp. LJL98]